MLSGKRFRATCAVAAAAAFVALPGCGGGSGDKKQSYKDDATKVANDFKTQAQAASSDLQSASTNSGRIQGLEKLKGSVNTAADGFAKLDPPDDVKSTNDDLVQELRGLAGDVDGVETALKTQDSSKAQAALTKLQSDQGKIDSTLQELQSKIGK
jgi:hypothetical protein